MLNPQGEISSKKFLPLPTRQGGGGGEVEDFQL